jgi:hypothetical protein
LLRRFYGKRIDCSFMGFFLGFFFFFGRRLGRGFFFFGRRFGRGFHFLRVCDFFF